MIFFASTLISIFKQTNIGNTFVAFFGNAISASNFSGLPLIILIFILVAISTIFVPSTTLKWYMLSTTIVPVMMESGMTPEFAQILYRFAETSTMNLTPLLAYFIVYFAFLQKYNKSDKKVSLFEAIKHQWPFALIIGITLLVIIIFWYIIGIPLGINSFPTTI